MKITKNHTDFQSFEKGLQNALKSSWNSWFVRSLYMPWITRIEILPNTVANARRTPLARCRRPSTIQARRAGVPMSSLNSSAVQPMMESCTQTADVVSRQHLRSASQRKMIVPRYRLDSYGRRCFAVAGPSTWNSLPDTRQSSQKSQFLYLAFSGVS